MNEFVQSTSTKGLIPNFFYDVIAFIIPGGFLVIGGLGMWFGPPLHKWLASPPLAMTKSPFPDMSSATAALIFAIFFLLFLGACSLVGFFLASLSHQAIERILWSRFKLSLADLSNYLGAEKIDKLKKLFFSQFGFALTDEHLERASFLCSYYIWRWDLNLGMMTARHDAERLASQSSLLVSGFLLIEALFHWGVVAHNWTSTYDLAWVVCLVFCIVGSALSFHYHRRKRVYTRFAIYLAIVSDKNANSIAHPSAKACE
jgi:hypothetical protein